MVEFFSDSETWKCPQCSFVNISDYTRCKMCQTQKVQSDFSDDEDDFNRPCQWIKEEDLVDLVTGSDVQLQLPTYSLSPKDVEKIV